MQEEIRKLSDHWKENYSSRVNEYRSFKVSKDFKRFASLFSLGNSYLYIVNLHDFQLEFVSESVKSFVGIDAQEVELKDLLGLVVPEELESINLKSRVINDFYTSFLNVDEVLDYKNMFSYRMKDAGGNIRSMLYQAIPLSVLENGAPEHVLCIQTDVSHLKVPSTPDVSFIHLNGEKSYFNVEVSKGKFDPMACEGGKKELAEQFSEREMQILIRLSRGMNADQIAEDLNLSPHTVKTHRRNILNRSGCSNTTELVAKCLVNGLISPNLN